MNAEHEVLTWLHHLGGKFKNCYMSNGKYTRDLHPCSWLRVCGAMSPVELRSILQSLCSKNICITNEMTQSQSSGSACRVHSWQGTSPSNPLGHPSSTQRHFLGDASSPISGGNHHQIVDMLSTLSNGIFPCRKNVLKMPTPPQCGKGLWSLTIQTL